MAGLNLGEGARKFFLLGVGAVAQTAEKSQEVINDLVAKGEITVSQGKALNEELSRKAKAAFDGSGDALMRSKLETMTSAERKAYIEKISKMAQEVDEKTCEVKVEVEQARSCCEEEKDTEE